MKKNIGEPKSFGKAMFSVAQLCQDYDQINVQGASDDVRVEEKKPIQKKIPIGQPNIKNVLKFMPRSVQKQPVKIQQKPVKIGLPKPIVKYQTHQLIFHPKKLQTTQLSELISTYSKPLTIKNEPVQQKHLSIPIEAFQPNAHMEFYYQGHDLKQGQIGDCYLISAISCLANKGNILNRCIQYLPPNLINSTKQFNCHIFDSGSMVDVKVKNLFSVNKTTNQPVYVKPIAGDITPLILQKAYAQVYGGYQNIVLGYSCDALRDLSGAPTEYIDLQDKNLLQKIKDAFQMGYVLTISSKTNPVNQGINKKHCYVICDFKSNNGLWIKLRNPSGYTPINPIVKQQTNFKQDLLQPNGLIWLPYSYILQNFEVISSCLIHPKYHYRYKTIQSTQLSKQSEKSLMFQTNQVIHGYITLHQVHIKHLKQSDYSYEVAKLIIAKIQRVNNNSYKVIETITGGFSCRQTCSVEVNLTPGRYVIYAQLNNLHKLVDKSKSFTLSFYTSSSGFQIYDIDPISPNQLIYNYIKNNEQKFQITKTEKTTRYFGTLFGYVIILFQNTTKNVTAYIDILYDQKNLKIDTNKLEVKPQQWKLVKNKICKQNNGSHKCNIKVNTVYK